MAWRGVAGCAGGTPVDNAVVVSGTFDNNPVTADLIAWGVAGEPDAGSLNNDAITDSAGNTGYAASSLLGTSGRKIKFYYKENAATTAGLVGTATNPNLMLGHTIFGACAALATSSALDEVAVAEQSAPGTATNAVTVTSAATDSDGQHIFAISAQNAAIDNFLAGTTPAGQTKGASTYPTSACSLTAVQTSAGAATATFTVDDGSGNFVTGIATFRAAGGGGGVSETVNDGYGVADSVVGRLGVTNTVNDGYGVADSTAATITYALPDEVLTLIDSIVGRLTVSPTVTDTITFTDAATATGGTVPTGDTVTDVLTLTDAVVQRMGISPTASEAIRFRDAVTYLLNGVPGPTGESESTARIRRRNWLVTILRGF